MKNSSPIYISHSLAHLREKYLNFLNEIGEQEVTQLC
jgi:hypothetical protein